MSKKLWDGATGNWYYVPCRKFLYTKIKKLSEREGGRVGEWQRRILEPNLKNFKGHVSAQVCLH